MVSKPKFLRTQNKLSKMLAFKKEICLHLSRTVVLTLAYKIASVGFNSLGSQKEELI